MRQFKREFQWSNLYLKKKQRETKTPFNVITGAPTFTLTSDSSVTLQHEKKHC